MWIDKPRMNLITPVRTTAGLLSYLKAIIVLGLRYEESLAPPASGEAAGNFEQSLHSMLEVIPAVALALDGTGQITGANERATRVLGYTLGEMTRLHIPAVLFPSHNDERPISFATLNGEQGLPHSVTRGATARAKNGADIEVRVRASAPLGTGLAARIVVVIEPDLDDAEGAVPGNGQRRLYRERASQVGEMAAALAHEVDQPLTAILSNAQAAQRFLFLDPPALSDLRELLGEVAADSMRAHAIIRKMRQSTRWEPAEAEPIDVRSLVCDVIRLLRRETKACDAVVDASFEDSLPQLHGDIVQLQQVLVNLLLNALDAVHERPIEDRRVRVIVTSSQDHHKIGIAIRDHGPGVDAERFATLFKPFVTSRPQGLGLGLSISRTIVMAHGGRIWVERNADSGMTFHVGLPVEPRP